MNESFEFQNLNNLSKESFYKKRKGKKYISCTKMNKYFLFPFITPIFITFRDIMINTIINHHKEQNFN